MSRIKGSNPFVSSRLKPLKLKSFRGFSGFWGSSGVAFFRGEGWLHKRRFLAA
ncbi:hypothetical protein [Sphaerotilus hippei]|uniref:hypothetical protein n=1 Tax=Sphaerotilus hippei TaxID=744406 RepID=UPI001473D70F|nr:hypothetical protein [Sphaerotilus hippei]